MESDELTPALPNTQNADLLTQSQDHALVEPLECWGTLKPYRQNFVKVELFEDNVFSLGRLESCSKVITAKVLDEKTAAFISKIHFRIYMRKLANSTGVPDNVVYLEDLSYNGTFVNKRLVGKGKTIILENKDIISVAIPNKILYMFHSPNSFDSTGLPDEIRLKYAVGKTLGTGACGVVKKVLTKHDSKKFALKIITKKGYMTSCIKQWKEDEKTRNEVNLCLNLKHPFIIKMVDFVETESMLCIVLELMEGGELFNRIKQKGRLTEKVTKLIFYQVILAVHYLHQKGITHRDLKPENILLATDDEEPLVKVSDFGLSKLVESENTLTTFCGTPMYVAPEILLSGGRGSYTKQVDVWSLGVILYCCLSGLSPFQHKHPQFNLEMQIVKGRYSFPSHRFDHISSHAKELIRRMMTTDPTKRITINQVLLHPWLHDREMREKIEKLMGTNLDENGMPEQDSENLPELLKRARIEKE